MTGQKRKHIVIVSYLATAAVGAVGLMLMMVTYEVAWGLCLGTVAILLALTLTLKRIEVKKTRTLEVETSLEERRRAA